ncbi:MAG TPA: glycosyltransferase, partial [Candidatus Bathyarchaeia archaeon]|nr:glycosyltransferase [Candidatus Bathyarchaeia archaeon]
ETFCCSAVEMMATGLPVLSVARGALPETIGPSGGAVLVNSPDDDFIAKEMADLLNAPERLMRMGKNGRDWVTEHYELDHIVDCWEQMLLAGPYKLDNVSGRWQGPKGMRYWIERLIGRTGCGKIFDIFLWLARRVKELLMR